ncbi:fimbria/pilus outer membrane usher protein [Ramlibacter tataouinensis]|uniref:fimbria/pilus outer membrane usher protein n=1 Tax=Ramlibacter tataouinensis TaxID=94132 RepID=UPI0022F37E1B|nr:fimbria/pilus outer membrane usher protein [Ramlibacter tataouinensis]WBY03763.1 fimbria/pilus outer membrane usher protein [Ramlibacter tataouinensis]
MLNLLLAAVLLPPATALSQVAAPAKAAQPTGEEAILTVTVNGIPRGEFTLIKQVDDYWLGAGEVQRLNLQRPPPPAQGGYVSVKSLGARSVRFDEAQLALHLEFPGESLQGTRIDLSSLPKTVPLSEAPPSLILSYRLSNRSAMSAGREWTAITDLNVRTGPLLLRQEHRLDIAGSQRRLARGRTQAILDQPAAARRWIGGDVVSTAGNFGSSITAAGLLVTKIWNMTPDAVRQPRAALHASTVLPAEVELSVDGSTVFRGNVGPGPIELDNLILHGGARNLRLTVTDVAGRRQVIEQPFLFADSALAKGVHDYSYFIGRRSELGPDFRWRYREGAWQAFHRYGATDSLTVSAGGEGSPDFTTAGVGATLRSDHAGLLSLDLLGQRQRSGGAAGGWSARYAYQTPRFSTLLGVRQFEPNFRSFAIGAGSFPRREWLAAASTSWGLATLAAELTRVESGADSRSIGTLRLYANLDRASLLSAEWQTTRSRSQQDHRLALVYRAFLDANNWAGGSAEVSSGAHTVTLETGRHIPQSEGFGYRAALSSTHQAGQESQTASLAGALNLRPATLELATTQQTGGRGFSEFALSGSLVAVDGEIGLTRSVHDSFILARLGAPQPGIQVMLNNQVQGTTDDKGRVFIPNVGAFDRQEVSVNDRQIPMTYQLGHRVQPIAPPYRSGLLVDFKLRRMHALVGIARRAQPQAPVASASWSMTAPSGKDVLIETTSTGDFYLEDVEAGTYRGTLEVDESRYACRLTVPEFDEPIYESAEGILCEQVR